MSNPTKASIYIQARLGGKTDEEANELAGYKGKTPGRVLDEYVHAQQVLDDTNTWGRGRASVLQEREVCEKQHQRTTASLRELRIKLGHLERRLRAYRSVEDYQSSRDGDDWGKNVDMLSRA